MNENSVTDEQGEAAVCYDAAELRRRLSISTLVFWQYRPIAERALAELTQNGITRVELLESPEQFDMADSRSMRHLRDLCDSCGVSIVAYHAHMTNFTGLDTESQRTARVDLCKRQIDTMLELGATVWGSHARAADPTLVTCYRELGEHVAGTQAFVTVENFGGPGTSVEERVVFLEEVDHPQAGMILDIGHVRSEDGGNPMTVPGGPTRVLNTCGALLRHVHLHGFKNGADHFPPLVDGDGIQWLELLRMLRAVEYGGWMNFEPSGEPKHQNALRAVGRFPERIVQSAAE